MSDAEGTKARILLVEGRRTQAPRFGAVLRRRGYEVLTAVTGAAALQQCVAQTPHLIVVHAASLGSSGKRICRRLREQAPETPLLLIVEAQHASLDGQVLADEVLVLPFTARKLLNRVRRFLPGVGQKVLRRGPIELDLERQRVRCLDKEAHLTPRLVRLLAALLSRPGQVWEREQLFAQVWRTDYTGDTRTLDVHISWLRRAIEPDPRHPRFIKTVRGVGYRLDVD